MIFPTALEIITQNPKIIDGLYGIQPMEILNEDVRYNINTTSNEVYFSIYWSNKDTFEHRYIEVKYNDRWKRINISNLFYELFNLINNIDKNLIAFI